MNKKLSGWVLWSEKKGILIQSFSEDKTKVIADMEVWNKHSNDGPWCIQPIEIAVTESVS